MNSQILMNNYLLLLKSTVEVYVHGTLESSNKKIRTLLQESLNTTIDSQNKTYQKMVDCQWYTVENTNTKEICKTLHKVENEK